MTDADLRFMQDCLKYLPDEETRDRATKIVLKAASDSFDLKAAKKLLSERRIKLQYEKGGSIKLTDKEIEKMPEYMKRLFAYDDKIVSYRITNGYFQARYRRNGYNITVTAKDFDTMKKKFIAKLDAAVKDREPKRSKADTPCSRTTWPSGWTKRKKFVSLTLW